MDISVLMEKLYILNSKRQLTQTKTANVKMMQHMERSYKYYKFV